MSTACQSSALTNMIKAHAKEAEPQTEPQIWEKVKPADFQRVS